MPETMWALTQNGQQFPINDADWARNDRLLSLREEHRRVLRQESHKLYGCELVVRVWSHSKSLVKTFKTGRVGHAAMTARWGDQSEYISWWPDGESGIFDGSMAGSRNANYNEDRVCEVTDRARRELLAGNFTPNPYQKPVITGKYDYHHPETLEERTMNTFDFGRSADVKVTLPCVGGRRHNNRPIAFGLCAQAAAEWYNQFAPTGEQDSYEYKMLSRKKNCSGVVRSALKAAGAEAYVQAPKAALVVLPNDIAIYARSLEHELSSLNNRYETFVQNSAQVLRSVKKHLPADAFPVGLPPTLKTWRELTQTHRNRPRCAQAMDQYIAAIDAVRNRATQQAIVNDRGALVAVLTNNRKIFEKAMVEAKSQRTNAHMFQMLTALAVCVGGSIH